MAISTIGTNLITDGTIATADIADDAVTSAKLDTNIDIAGTLDVTGVLTADNNATIAGTLGVTGVISPTTHIDMPDNAYIKLGTSDDLLIYHDASHSYIEDDGTGDLRLKGSTVRLQGTGGTNLLVGSTGGATSLYHNNATKLATASGGVTVTGTLTATTLAGTLSTAAQTNITSLGTLTGLTVNGATTTNALKGGSTNFDIYQTTSDGSDNRRTRIGGGGDVAQSRGAFIELAGNEHSDTGDLILNAGDVSGGDILLKTDNITRVFVKDDGDVGVGTTSPNDKFDVLGSSTTLDIGADDSAEVVAGFVPDSTNNRNGRLRIAGTTTPTNNSIALISDSSSNVGMSFVTTGSGTKGERMVIGTTGNVGIGTTSPSSKLTVTEAGDGNTPTMHIIDSADTEVAWFEGNRAGDTGAYIAIRHNPSSPANSNRAGIKFQADDSAGNVTNYATAKMYISDNTNGSEDASLAFNTIKDGTDTEALRVQAGFVGIGDPAANDGEKFKVENNGTCAATIYANEDSSARDAILRLQTRNGSAQSKIVWLYGDGAGTYNGEIMHDYGEDTTSFVVPNTKSNSAGAFMYIGRTNEGSQYSGLQVFQIGGASAADRKWKFQTIEQGVSNSGDLVFQQSGGLVGIGTDNPVAKLTVNGSFSKSSGSFRIPHPLPALSDTKDLVHSFIEGPQADLIYRGTVDLVNGSATVNIDTVAGMTDGTFVALCREVQCFTTNEDNWDLVKASVSGNILTIQSQNSSSTATISWLVIGERKDPHMYDTEWTDSEGKIIIEPNQRK